MRTLSHLPSRDDAARSRRTASTTTVSVFRLVASRSITSCAVPTFNVLKTVLEPLDDQSTGFLNIKSEVKNSVSGWALSTSLSKNCWRPDRSEANRMRRPSGDQTGESLRPRLVYNGTTVPRARSASQRPDSDADTERTTAAWCHRARFE